MHDTLKYCNIAYDYDIPEFFFDRNSDNFLAILGESLGLFYRLLPFLHLMPKAKCTTRYFLASYRKDGC